MEKTHPTRLTPTSQFGCFAASITPDIKHSKVTHPPTFETASKLEVPAAGPSWPKRRFAHSWTQDTSAESTLQMSAVKGVMLQERIFVGHPKDRPYHKP